MLPELVLVHGAWHGSWAWERLLPVLRERGWAATAIDLPSSGSRAGLAADGEAVRRALDQINGPAVLVGHSYGGTAITEGGAGVANLVGLAYVCAAMPDEGEQVWTDFRSPEQVPPWIDVVEEEEAIYAQDSERVLYNDCEADIAAAAAARLKPQSLASFMDPVTGVAWREKPTAYLICDLDQCVDASAQATIAEHADSVERLAASHSPFLSRPSDVEEFLRRAVARF